VLADTILVLAFIGAFSLVLVIAEGIYYLADWIRKRLKRG